MLIQSYVSGARNRHSEVHKDSSGDFVVHHYQAGQKVKIKVHMSHQRVLLFKGQIAQSVKRNSLDFSVCCPA